jgi:hypothetical protein
MKSSNKTSNKTLMKSSNKIVTKVTNVTSNNTVNRIYFYLKFEKINNLEICVHYFSSNNKILFENAITTKEKIYKINDKLFLHFTQFDDVISSNMTLHKVIVKNKDVLINALTHILTNISISPINVSPINVSPIKSNKMITNFPHNKNIINKQLKNDIEEELSKLLGAIII